MWQSEVSSAVPSADVGGVISSKVAATRERFQVNVRPEALGFETYWQGSEKVEVLADLRLRDTVTPVVRSEDAVSDFKCPDFRYNRLIK